jgi:DNA mismatch endonuclease (patch repair protein)
MGKTSPNKGSRDVSAIMRRVHSTDTTPEVALRKALADAGFRLMDSGKKELPGKPDIILSEEHIAIFVDGDFWHGGQWRRRKFVSLEEQFKRSASKDYWVAKIRRNVERDFRNTGALIEEGWMTLRFWESSIKKDVGGCVERVIRASKKGLRPDICSLIPARTFAYFNKADRLRREGLERNGWACLEAGGSDTAGDLAGMPPVTLLTAAFSQRDIGSGRRPAAGQATSTAFAAFARLVGGLKRRRPPLLLLQVAAVTAFGRGAGGLEYVLRELNGLGYTVDAFGFPAFGHGSSRSGGIVVAAVLESCIPAEELKEAGCLYADPVRPPALAAFINNHTGINWNIRPLPPLPTADGAAAKGEGRPPLSEWLAVYYLNPLMNELMKGRPLARYRV